jgi:hypothetical protein
MLTVDWALRLGQSTTGRSAAPGAFIFFFYRRSVVFYFLATPLLGERADSGRVVLS